ncbi:MAG: NAD(P)H-dependent glycerol-3-phosphate dehydrogenase [Coriobacteriales bacterium]|jgi:glycerol-3-phosphate dehydrogenase (NAD(P)+)
MKISVIGAGAFGFSIASRLCTNPDHEVVVWAEVQSKVDEFYEKGSMACVLNDVPLPRDVEVTASMERAVAGQDLIFVLPAAAFVESVCEQMAPHLAASTPVIIGSKGACPNGEMPAAGAERALGREISTMGGPGFAIDILEGVPVGFTLATRDDACFDLVREAFAHDATVTLDRSADTLGIELASCIKNAAAIATGALHGAGYPISTQCLLMQRVLSDLGDMLEAIPGGSRETALSLAGVGDMALTCFSPKSRNCSFGRLVGEFGYSSPEAQDYLAKTTVEGVSVVRSWPEMSGFLGVSSPFMDAARKAFSEGGTVEQLLDCVM